MLFPPIIKYISGLTLVFSLILLAISIVIKRKDLIKEMGAVPRSIFGLNLGLFLWFILTVEKNFSGRGDMGVWLFSTPNINSWSRLFLETRSPVYFWRTKALNELFDGVGYDFMANVGFITFLFSILLIYLAIKNITENKTAAYLSSLFYALNPIVLTFSMTEDYVLLALFFAIISLFFASLWVKNKDNFYLIPMMASALLAAGSRVDYIFLPYFIIFFYLLFAEKRQGWRFLTTILIFVLVTIPRTITSLSMYFGDAQWDYALHEQVYNYTGDTFPYIVRVIIGSSNFFIRNLNRSLNIFLNPSNFTLFFLIFGVLSLFLLFKKEKKEVKKIIIFLLSQFIFLFFYYNYFHAKNGATAFRYQITIITPLLILSGIFISSMLKKKKAFLYPLMSIFFILSFITLLFPLSFREHIDLLPNRSLKSLFVDSTEKLLPEYYQYKQLTYENRLSRIRYSDFDVFKGNNTYFLTNGERSVLHSMPINGTFIPVTNVKDLEKFYQKVETGDVVYVSQSQIGFISHTVDEFSSRSVDPKKFKKAVLDLFEIKEVLINYEIDGLQMFLLRVQKR